MDKTPSARALSEAFEKQLVTLTMMLPDLHKRAGNIRNRLGTQYADGPKAQARRAAPHLDRLREPMGEFLAAVEAARVLNAQLEMAVRAEQGEPLPTLAPDV